MLISCVSACGKCVYCRKLMYSHCTTGGWILGNTIDGTQAEFVRTPHADLSLYHIPDGADEEALVTATSPSRRGWSTPAARRRCSTCCRLARSTPSS